MADLTVELYVANSYGNLIRKYVDHAKTRTYPQIVEDAIAEGVIDEPCIVVCSFFEESTTHGHYTQCGSEWIMHVIRKNDKLKVKLGLPHSETPITSVVHWPPKK